MISGNRKARVLPLPVGAQASRFRSCRYRVLGDRKVKNGKLYNLKENRDALQLYSRRCNELHTLDVSEKFFGALVQVRSKIDKGGQRSGRRWTSHFDFLLL